MQSTNYSQRIFCFTHDQAVQACSDIGYLVQKAGFSGINALRLESALYTTLYTEACALNATPAALQYVENRRREVSAELDTIRSCSPDLFDGWVERNGIECLLRRAAQ